MTLEEKTRGKEQVTLVKCDTTTGLIVMKLQRKWSPIGYDRAVELFSRGFYDDTHFFRAVPKFLVQFGITYSSDKELVKFARTPIRDDPKYDPPIAFHKGTISYAGGGANSRTSQLFISYGDAKSLGTQLWETPIGEIVEGMENAEKFYSYGDMPPWGKGPIQGKIHNGRKYIDEHFPLIDSFHKCIVETDHIHEQVKEHKTTVPEIIVPALRVKAAIANAEEQTNYAPLVVVFLIIVLALVVVISCPLRKKNRTKNF